MSTLDRYIARQYLVNIIALVVVLFAFIITIDLSLNFDDFMSMAQTRGATAEGEPSAVRKLLLAVFLVFDYWWPKLIQLFNYLIGLVVIGAMGFTCAQMARHREFVAALAGGVSLFRLLRPLLLVALLMTTIQAFNFEFVIPRLADLIQRNRDQASQRRLDDLPVRLVPDSMRRLFYARSFDAEAGVLTDLTVLERSPLGPAVRAIVAPRAVWRDGGWDLEGGFAESRSSQQAPRQAVARIETDLDPVAIKVARFAGYSQSLSWRQISELLRRPELLGLGASPEGRDPTLIRQRVEELERIRFGRVAIMLSNLLSLLIVTPFFLRKEPSNVLLSSLKAAPLAVVGVLGGVLGASAAVPGLPPSVGVFVPALILLPMAIAAVTSIRS